MARNASKMVILGSILGVSGSQGPLGVFKSVQDLLADPLLATAQQWDIIRYFDIGKTDFGGSCEQTRAI